jgi:hypothetical protein
MLKTEFTFDGDTYRHTVNGHESVLHCRHYMALTTKLALDFESIGGTQILRESAEDSIRPMLDDYFKTNNIVDPAERLKIGAEYFSLMGMGTMTIDGTQDSGEARLTHSHVDEGWLKKWDKSTKPLNFFSCGFIDAIFAAAYNLPPRSFKSEEVSSIAVGNEESIISVRRK